MTLALLLACTGNPINNNDNGGGGPIEDTAGADYEAPDFEFTEVESPHDIDKDVVLEAVVTDDSGVLAVSVFYRRQTSADFKSIGMLPDGTPGGYSGLIRAEDLGTGGMHYYLQAVDTRGNVGTWPEGAPNEYFRFDLTE